MQGHAEALARPVHWHNFYRQ